MRCVRCGAELPSDAAFCSKCGAPQGGAPPSQRRAGDGTRGLIARLKPAAVTAEDVAAKTLDYSVKGLSRLSAKLDERRQRLAESEVRTARDNPATRPESASVVDGRREPPDVGPMKSLDEFFLFEQLALLFNNKNKDGTIDVVRPAMTSVRTWDIFDPLMFFATMIGELCLEDRLVLHQNGGLAVRPELLPERGPNANPDWKKAERETLLIHTLRVGRREPIGDEILDGAASQISAYCDQKGGECDVLEALLLLWGDETNAGRLWDAIRDRMIRGNVWGDVDIRFLRFFEGKSLRFRNPDLVRELEARLEGVLSGEAEADPRTSLMVSLMFAMRYQVPWFPVAEQLGRFSFLVTPRSREVVLETIRSNPLGQSLCGAVLKARQIQGKDDPQYTAQPIGG